MKNLYKFLHINNKTEMSEKKKMLDGKLWRKYLFYFPFFAATEPSFTSKKQN